MPLYNRLVEFETGTTTTPRRPRCICDRPLRGDEFTAAYVAGGSTAARRVRDQDARQPTLKSGFWTAAIRLLTVTARSRSSSGFQTADGRIESAELLGGGIGSISQHQDCRPWSATATGLSTGCSLALKRLKALACLTVAMKTALTASAPSTLEIEEGADDRSRLSRQNVLHSTVRRKKGGSLV